MPHCAPLGPVPDYLICELRPPATTCFAAESRGNTQCGVGYWISSCGLTGVVAAEKPSEANPLPLTQHVTTGGRGGDGGHGADGGHPGLIGSAGHGGNGGPGGIGPAANGATGRPGQPGWVQPKMLGDNQSRYTPSVFPTCATPEDVVVQHFRELSEACVA
jgi:hypothetical protein